MIVFIYQPFSTMIVIYYKRFLIFLIACAFVFCYAVINDHIVFKESSIKYPVMAGVAHTAQKG